MDDEGILKRSALQGLQDRQNWGPQQVRLHVSIFACLPFRPSVIALLAFESVWNQKHLLGRVWRCLLCGSRIAQIHFFCLCVFFLNLLYETKWDIIVSSNVYVIAGCADLTSLDSMSLQEKKRQGYIHELIETEEKYMEDLQLVLEVYFHSDVVSVSSFLLSSYSQTHSIFGCFSKFLLFHMSTGRS